MFTMEWVLVFFLQGEPVRYVISYPTLGECREGYSNPPPVIRPDLKKIDWDEGVCLTYTADGRIDQMKDALEPVSETLLPEYYKEPSHVN